MGFMIFGVCMPLPKKNFAFSELKGLILGPFFKFCICKYELWILEFTRSLA